MAQFFRLSFALAAAFVISMAVRSHNDTTVALVISSVLMFAFCWAHASHLLGAKAALKLVLIASTELLKRADTAMYEGKSSGKNCLRRTAQ